MQRHKKPQDFQTDDLLASTHRRLAIWPHQFDLLDSSLLRALDVIILEELDLFYERDAPAPVKAIYHLYMSIEPDGLPFWLGNIELRKTANETTEVVIHRNATGSRAFKFEKIVNRWNAYINFDGEIAAITIKKSNETPNKDATKKTRGVTGRPHLSDDLWAWEQVNIHARMQLALVIRKLGLTVLVWVEKTDPRVGRCRMQSHRP